MEGVSKGRYVSSKEGDTITFTLTNATAFALHGATDEHRRGVQVTVTPPAIEGPPRGRLLNDGAPLNNTIIPEVIHYLESGLNRTSQYDIEVLNPFADNIIDLRYLQILDAVPQ